MVSLEQIDIRSLEVIGLEFNVVIGILVGIILGIVLTKIIHSLFFSNSNNLKGGKKEMAGKKKIKKSKTSSNELGENYLDELDDIENNGSDEQEEVPEENQILDQLQDIENRLEKYENGITINQKYIKKIWDKLKELEENFNLLIKR